ncbi:YidC/Oxa1 family membrane protein insertase [Candidatus Woesebacteria bacterium]|nr:YidC/Oxa1 family membrane protein insertase [Candidatus Woesebacteria bacterium]
MLVDLFITVIYQPFFNILVGFYWILGFFTDGKPDMGIAVILLTILIRILLLPLSLSGDKSEDERREISKKILDIEETYSTEPIKLEAEKKKVIKLSRKVMVSEMFNLFIQVSIALMLWKIFKTGLEGADIHLIYSFMPKFDLPFNLMFLGKYDLSRTNFVLNLIQSLLIFVLESISLLTSPYKVSRSEVVRLQLVLPLVSFLIFMGLPAGKKLFVITSLIFSIILTIYKIIKRKLDHFHDSQIEQEAAKTEEPATEKIVVATK